MSVASRDVPPTFLAQGRRACTVGGTRAAGYLPQYPVALCSSRRWVSTPLRTHIAQSERIRTDGGICSELGQTMRGS